MRRRFYRGTPKTRRSSEQPNETPSVPQHGFRRQLVKNTMASGAANVWAMVAALVSVPLLVHGLGIEQFGAWALVLTFSATNGWLSLADLGVVVATTREVSVRAAADDSEGIGKAVGAGATAVVGLALAAGSILALAAVSFLPNAFGMDGELATGFRIALLVMSIQVVVDLIVNLVEGALEGLQRVDVSRAIDSFRRLIVVIGTSTAAVVSGDIRWVAVSSLVATVLAAIVAAVSLVRRLPHRVVRPSRQETLGLVRSGRSVAALRPLGVIQRTMDRTLVGIVLGPGAVALVEVATQLAGGADAVLGATSYSVVPASAWLGARGDVESITEMTVRGTRYSMLATVPVAIAVATLAGPFIDLWVGDRFSEAAGLAAVAAVGVICNAPLAVGSQMLVGLGQARTVLISAVGALLLNLVVSFVLLHAIGIVGVFIGTIAAALLLFVLMGPGVLKAAQLSWSEFARQSLFPVVPAAIAQVVVALLVLRIPVDPFASMAVTGFLSIGAFIVVAMVTGLTPSERRRVRDLLPLGA